MGKPRSVQSQDKEGPLSKSKSSESFEIQSSKSNSISSRGLVILAFHDRNYMADCLYRAQLYYEDAELRGKWVCTDEYRKRGRRRFDGYNLPVSSLKEWAELARFNNDLTQPESTLLIRLQQHSDVNKKGRKQGSPPTYILAHLSTDSSSHLHELLHFLYYSNETYRDMVSKHYTKLSTTTLKELGLFLSGKGYHHDVWMDEWQAFLVEDRSCFGRRIMMDPAILTAWQELSPFALEWVKMVEKDF